MTANILILIRWITHIRQKVEPHASRIFPILYSLEFIDLNQHYWLSLNKFKLNQISTSMTYVVLPRHIHDH